MPIQSEKIWACLRYAVRYQEPNQKYSIQYTEIRYYGTNEEGLAGWRSDKLT